MVKSWKERQESFRFGNREVMRAFGVLQEGEGVINVLLVLDRKTIYLLGR